MFYLDEPLDEMVLSCVKIADGLSADGCSLSFRATLELNPLEFILSR